MVALAATETQVPSRLRGDILSFPGDIGIYGGDYETKEVERLTPQQIAQGLKELPVQPAEFVRQVSPNLFSEERLPYREPISIQLPGVEIAMERTVVPLEVGFGLNMKLLTGPKSYWDGFGLKTLITMADMADQLPYDGEVGQMGSHRSTIDQSYVMYRLGKECDDKALAVSGLLAYKDMSEQSRGDKSWTDGADFRLYRQMLSLPGTNDVRSAAYGVLLPRGGFLPLTLNRRVHEVLGQHCDPGVQKLDETQLRVLEGRVSDREANLFYALTGAALPGFVTDPVTNTVIKVTNFADR